MIIGSSVLIRGVESEDLGAIYRWSNDLEIKELFDSIIEFSSYDELVARIDSNHGSKDYAELTIVEKESKKPVGMCALRDIDFINKKALCSLYIGDKESRDKGYGTEAMGLLIKFAFHELNLNRLGLWVFDFNKGAIKCYKRCGMKVEGIMREGIYRDGKYHDMYFMGILRDEYEEIAKGGSGECSEVNM